MFTRKNRQKTILCDCSNFVLTRRVGRPIIDVVAEREFELSGPMF